MSGVSDPAGIGEEFDGTFTCLTCGKSYTAKSYAVRHFQDVHTAKSKKSYECQYCGRFFKAKRYRQDHVRRGMCPIANKLQAKNKNLDLKQ